MPAGESHNGGTAAICGPAAVHPVDWTGMNVPDPLWGSPLVAHTPNGSGAWHLLEEHLRGTAERARSFAADISQEAASLAYQAGLWHDLGKAHPTFQRYLLDQARGVGKRRVAWRLRRSCARAAGGVTPGPWESSDLGEVQ